MSLSLRFSYSYHYFKKRHPVETNVPLLAAFFQTTRLDKNMVMSWMLMDTITQNSSPLQCLLSINVIPNANPGRPSSAFEYFPGYEKLGKKGRLVLR